MRYVIPGAGRLALLVGALAVVVAFTACGSDGKDKGAQASSGVTTGAVDASGNITIVGKDNFYEPSEFTGPANQKVTVTLDNKGASLHDLRIKDQKRPDGQEIQTALLPAGEKGSVEFTLAAGTYEFYCAVHPADMRGRMTLG